MQGGADGLVVGFHRSMIVVCVAVFFWQVSIGLDESIRLAALRGADVAADPWRCVTAGFMHGSGMHLLFNMVALWMVGPLVETICARAGVLHRWTFPVLYLGSLVGGSVGALVLEFDVFVVGASGAVFGLLAASVVVSYRLGFGWNGTGVLPWLVVNAVITFAVPGISVGGHVGGALTGAALGWFLVSPARFARFRALVDGSADDQRSSWPPPVPPDAPR